MGSMYQGLTASSDPVNSQHLEEHIFSIINNCQLHFCSRMQRKVDLKLIPIQEFFSFFLQFRDTDGRMVLAQK